VSGTGGTVTTPASPTSTFTGTQGTVYTLRWTITNSTCTPSTDDVIITFDQTPTTSNAGPDQTVCNTSVTLAANAPTTGTGAWEYSGAEQAVHLQIPQVQLLVLQEHKEQPTNFAGRSVMEVVLPAQMTSTSL